MTGSLPWTVLLMPLIFMPFMAFLIGMAWFLCAIGAFTRDAGYLMINIVPLFMFATPVFYPHSSLPPPFDFLIYANALTGYVEVMRDIVLLGKLPNLLVYCWMLVDLGRHLLLRLLVLRQVSECHRRRHLKSSSQARHLGKAYQLYARRSDWLKQVMFGWWKSYFKPFWVLRDIDLDVYRGESIGILGRNGCGKSTLLQVICGMTLPSNGELRVTGRIAPVLALGATFDAELSGRENVMIGGAVLGLKRSEVLRKFNSIAEFAGIGDYMEQPVKHYSMGMRTRLAFAICAHVEAEILVVDEALAVGDAAFQRKCLDWIDNFRKNGTLLFVSHSTAEVRRLCTRAIWIEDGRIRAQGEPSVVIRAYHRALAMEKDDVHRFSAGE